MLSWEYGLVNEYDSNPWCTSAVWSLLRNISEGCVSGGVGVCVPCGHPKFLSGNEFKLLMVKTDGFVMSFFFSASFLYSATEWFVYLPNKPGDLLPLLQGLLLKEPKSKT